MKWDSEMSPIFGILYLHKITTIDPKGNVWIKRTFEHTKLWPERSVNLLTGAVIDLEKDYKEALAGRMVTVMDIAVDGSGYLVLGNSEKTGHFLWTVEKGDTMGFIPVVKKYGTLMPAGLSPIEEFAWMEKNEVGMFGDVMNMMNDLHKKG
jgi:hypothetical protein